MTTNRRDFLVNSGFALSTAALGTVALGTLTLP